MAARRRLGQLADTLLKAHLNQKQADYENGLLMQRQSSLADQNFMNTILGKVVNSPGLANRMQQQGLSQIAGIPLDVFGSDSSDALKDPTKQIAEAKTPEDLGSLRGRFEQYRQGVVGNDTPGGVSLNDISNLGNTFNAQQKQIGLNEEGAMDRAAASAHNNAYNSATGADQAANENFSTKLGQENQSGIQSNNLRLALEKSLNPVMVQRAGQSSGASAAAQFPYSKPDILSDAKTGDARAFRFGPGGAQEVPNLPPGLTENVLREPQQLVVRRQAAEDALSQIDTARRLLGAVNTRGLIGPLLSRYNQLLGTGLKAEDAIAQVNAKDLGLTGQNAMLLNDFTSTMRLLSSQAAVAHGGARGGGSPQMAHIFEAILNGLGDQSATEGQLNAMERLMRVYAKDPNAPPELDLKQYGFQDPSQSGPGATLSPRLQQRITGGR